MSGHIYFKENNYFELPLLTMLKLIKIMAEKEEGIDKLVKPFETWHSSEEINIDIQYMKHSLDYLFRELINKYQEGGRVDDLDGITIEHQAPKSSEVDRTSWWFNLRPSNTEPVIRLTVEAKTEDLLNEKVGEITEVIKAV